MGFFMCVDFIQFLNNLVISLVHGVAKLDDFFKNFVLFFGLDGLFWAESNDIFHVRELLVEIYKEEMVLNKC